MNNNRYSPNIDHESSATKSKKTSLEACIISKKTLILPKSYIVKLIKDNKIKNLNTKIAQHRGIKPRRLSLDDRMMNYINKRYTNDKFTLIGRKSGIYDETQQEILVKSEKYPGKQITVAYTKINGKEIFNDNYMYFVYKERTMNFFENILKSVFKLDFKFFYGGEPGVGIKKLSNDATFDDYISNIASKIRFTAVFAPGYNLEDKNLIINDIKKAFADNNVIILTADLRFCEDTNTYNSLNEQTLINFLFSFDGLTLDMNLIGMEKENFTWR